MDWLNEAPSQALQRSLKNLDAAWARRLDSLKKLKQGRINRAQQIGEPVFKKKEKHASFRYPQGTCLEQNNNRIWLPQLGWVRYRNSREVRRSMDWRFHLTLCLNRNQPSATCQAHRDVLDRTPSGFLQVGVDVNPQTSVPDADRRGPHAADA